MLETEKGILLRYIYILYLRLWCK